MSGTRETVFIVDDDRGFRTAVERLLTSSGYVAECFSSAEEFLAQLSAERTGCALVDLQMPGMDGMALLAALAESRNPLPVVFLTGHGDVPTGVAAIRDGAEDFLLKTAPKDTLLAAIDRALARDVREREERLRREALRARFDSLTPRERDVLSQVLEGRLNKQIAAHLGIDERSVKRHRTNLNRKLNVRSVAELTRLAVEVGIRATDPTR